MGFLGPNGAGKTTTILMLCTLIKPTDGTATICGYDVAKHPDEVRSCIGWAPQDIAVDERLTGRENLNFTQSFIISQPTLRKRGSQSF